MKLAAGEGPCSFFSSSRKQCLPLARDCCDFNCFFFCWLRESIFIFKFFQKTPHRCKIFVRSDLHKTFYTDYNRKRRCIRMIWSVRNTTCLEIICKKNKKITWRIHEKVKDLGHCQTETDTDKIIVIHIHIYIYERFYDFNYYKCINFKVLLLNHYYYY